MVENISGTSKSYTKLTQDQTAETIRMSQERELRAPGSVAPDRTAVAPAITTQPMIFQVANLDPPSQMLYNSLNSTHMSGSTVTASMDLAGQELINSVQGKYVSLKGNMSYSELLRGLTHDGEQILSTDPHLQFSSWTIGDEFGTVRETRVGGIALLTDRRLLLLSSQYFQTSSMTSFGDPKKLPGGYTMEMSCKDNTYYFPLSLELFHSIEMAGRSGVSGSISVHGRQPPCWGLLGCCGCLKGWTMMPMVYSEFNQRSLKFGVLMPPWQHKSFITLDVPSNVPIHYMRDFISLFQRQAKYL